MLAGCCLKSTGVKTEVRQLSSLVSVIFLSSFFILHSSFLFPPFTCRNVFFCFCFPALRFVISSFSYNFVSWSCLPLCLPALFLLIHLIRPLISTFSIYSSPYFRCHFFLLLLHLIIMLFYFYFFHSLFPTSFLYPLVFILRSFPCLFLHFILYFPFCLRCASPFVTVHVSVLDLLPCSPNTASSPFPSILSIFLNCTFKNLKE